jgi:hypothetical protein
MFLQLDMSSRHKSNKKATNQAVPATLVEGGLSKITLHRMWNGPLRSKRRDIIIIFAFDCIVIVAH